MEIDEAEYNQMKLDIEATNVKIKEFRDTNINLKQALETFDGVDVDEYKRFKVEADAVEKQELLKSGDVEAILAKEKADADKRIEALNLKISELDGTITTMTVTDRLKAAAGEVGARAEAIDDLVRVVGGEWELRDGEAVHLKNGEVVLSPSRAGENMDMKEYFAAVAISKPFYFGASNGADGEQARVQSDGVRIIANTPENLGTYSKEIREGKVVVQSLQSQVAV